jgi:predicted GTPase
VIIINKVNTAEKEDTETVRNNIKNVNSDAQIIEGISAIIADDKYKIKDKRVLVIEDGPTVTHGGMKFGAGKIAAERWGAKEIIDPRPYAAGSIVNTFNKYTHLLNVLPAMGYSKKQIQELEETINSADCDLVISGTPIDITRILSSSKPIVRVKYDVGEETAKELEIIVEKFVKKHLS